MFGLHLMRKLSLGVSEAVLTMLTLKLNRMITLIVADYLGFLTR